MYGWKIELTLNSGKELTVYYEGYESNSLNVAKRLLEARDGDIMAFGNKEKTKQFFVRRNEVASMAVSAD